jgi:thiol:disulfide interchange protein
MHLTGRQTAAPSFASAPALMTKKSLPALGLFLALAAAFALLGAPRLAAQPDEVVKLELAPASLAAGAEGRIVAQVEVAEHWHTNSNTPTLDFLIPTELALELPAGASGLEVEYPQHKMLKFPYTEEPIAVYDGRFEVVGKFQLAPDAKPGKATVKAVLAYQACDDKQCLPPSEALATLEVEVKAAGAAAAAPADAGTPTPPPVAATPEPAAPIAAPAAEPAQAAAPAATSNTPSLWRILLFAVVGGLILNLMPCVLPVLSLKIFGLVKSAGQGRSHLVAGALATTFGVLFSFWILAAAAVGAAAAGAAVGWGVQFQQPGFVAFLAVVVVLFSLNMWGLFEIPLPQSLARMGSSGPRKGLGGHFFSGLFATLMATPCSAPFLGTAIGFALGQPAPVVFLVFTAVGLGLALPYLVLAAFPRAAALLPKPGDWMITFRNLMGFLLAAAAVWLFYVLSGQIRAEWVAYVQLALLGLALAAFLLGQAAHGSPRRALAAAAMVAAAALTVGLAVKAPAKAAAGAADGKHLAWIAFDEQEAKNLAAGGRPVFVDFTADWCLTCKANERLVIDTPEVAAAFERHQVVAMKGDWTSRDDRITDFLKRYGRSAVPFYVLFRPGAEPHAFGEVLTQATLIRSVEAAATKTARLD